MTICAHLEFIDGSECSVISPFKSVKESIEWIRNPVNDFLAVTYAWSKDEGVVNLRNVTTVSFYKRD